MTLRSSVLVLVLSLSVLSSGTPLSGATDGTPLRVQVFKTFDDVAGFLRHWFSVLQNRLVNSNENDDPVLNPTSDESDDPVLNPTSAEEPGVHDIQKRHVQPPPKFEDIEKEYMINMSMNYLKQFVGYAVYVNNDMSNQTKSELDDIVRTQGEKMSHMSVEQLRTYMGSLKRSLQTGVNNKHVVTINGATYSLDHIASWCCPF